MRNFAFLFTFEKRNLKKIIFLFTCKKKSWKKFLFFAITLLNIRFVNNKIIRQKWNYTEISKNDFKRIRVLFVKHDNRWQRLLLISNKIFLRYRVLFIEIKLLKHENHDTRKRYVDIKSIIHFLTKFSWTSTFCQKKKFKHHLLAIRNLMKTIWFMKTCISEKEQCQNYVISDVSRNASIS